MAKPPLRFDIILMMTVLTVTNLRFINTAQSQSPSTSPPLSSSIINPPAPLLLLSPPVAALSPSPSPSSSSTSAPPLPSPPPPPPQQPPSTTRNPPPPLQQPPATPRNPPPPPKIQEDHQQFNNIIDALIGAGDFGGWVSILSAANSSSFPLTATLFVPGEDQSHLFSGANKQQQQEEEEEAAMVDPLMIPYHIVPQRLTFSDLQLFRNKTRLPTLLPTKSILITSNSPSNFTLDDSPITHPDLYLTASVAVHGVKSVLNYSAYGGDRGFYSSLPTPEAPMVGPPPPPPPRPFILGGEGDQVTIVGSDGGACLCTEFPMVFTVACAAFAFKMHRNLLPPPPHL